MYGKWLFKELKTEYGHCRVEVFRKGYTASAIEIGALVGNSLNLALENLDTITAPIGKSVCSFEIYDTEQFEYDDLFTPDATAYKVVVSTKVDGGEYNTRWSGYVTPDFFAENLSFRTPISISARDNIGYLNDVDFDLDTATITVRELIQAAFNRIAEDYPMSLSFVTQKQTAEGILAIDATISTYLLREMSWYEALETILHDLGLQMRWVDNNTIAVLDISQLGENFGLQRFNFIERSGYREILPAWRELSQKQDYGLRENFFEGRIKEENLTFVKEEKVTIAGYSADFTNLRFFSINNWVGNGLTINYSDYFFTIGGAMSESERNRIYFTGIDKNSTAYADKYIGWRQRVHKSTNAMKVTFKALNSIQVASSNVYTGVPFLQTFGPYSPGTAQFGLKANILLHSGAKTYVMRYNWEEMTSENETMSFVLSELSGGAIEEECTIDISNIPYDGELELRIYGWYFISATNWTSMPLNAVSYITDVVYSYDGSVTGQNAKVTVAELHNIKEDRDYSFGQVPLDCGGINAYAGGLFKANGDELVGFKRNVDGSTYPLLELVGREIIHFNKKNYNKLSGTIRNLAKEPLRFDKVFVYKGKNYLPFAYSLDVISNTMNITTMQEVEPYTTHSFVEIKSELVTGGGATISGGNNTALQYSAEVGNAKRISELNNASESEKKESYIVIDNANWNESKKVPLSEMEGLDEAQVEAYLTENKYAKQSWVKGITDDLETDIANRVLIEDFEKLQEAVDLNYTNLNKATTRISTLEGYFSNGVANNAAKLGGQLPSYYATKSALDTTNTNLSNLSTTVGTIAGNLSSLTGRVSTAEDTIKGHTSSISKAVADIAANAKNISANLAAITTLNSKVTKLESYWYIDNNGNLHTSYNVISDNDVIAGGEYSGGTGGGGGTGGFGSITIKTASGQEYKTNANGVVTIPDYQPKGNYLTSVPSGYATESWVGDNYQPKGNYLTAIPTEYITESELTAKKYLTGITSAMVTTALGYVPFNSTSFTKATIKSTLGIADWALAASKPSYSWSEITSKPTFATVATSGKYSDLSGTPTSLPASDVYAWAKAVSKPTYTASEVGALSTEGGTISKSSYVPLVIQNTASDLSTILFKGASGDLGYLGFNGASNPIYMAPSGYAYTLYHTGNFNPANYLPLSGGTIKGSITAKRYYFGDKNDNGYGYLTVDDSVNSRVYYVDNLGAYNILIHTGNIGSSNAGSADILAKSHSGNINFSAGSALKLIGDWGEDGVSLGYPTKYQAGLSVMTDFVGWQMTVDAGAVPNPYFRSLQDTGVWKEWKQLAFLTDNVASATKLQTARTIWGQSFDGTGNVSGTLSGVGNIYINKENRIYLNDGTSSIDALYLYSALKTIFVGYGAGKTINTALAGNEVYLYYGGLNKGFTLSSSGNVLIGTTTDSGHKLQVNGDIKATGDGIFGSDARYKSKLQDLAVDLTTIANAPVFSYKWTDREDDKVHLGTTAQYWLDTNFRDAVDTSNKDFYHLNYGALGVAIGVTLAKEQIKVKNEVERLRERVNELENQVKQLRQWHN